MLDLATISHTLNCFESCTSLYLLLPYFPVCLLLIRIYMPFLKKYTDLCSQYRLLLPIHSIHFLLKEQYPFKKKRLSKSSP